MATPNLASPTDPNDERRRQLSGAIQNVPQWPNYRNFTEFTQDPVVQDKAAAMVYQNTPPPPSASMTASMQASGTAMHPSFGTGMQTPFNPQGPAPLALPSPQFQPTMSAAPMTPSLPLPQPTGGSYQQRFAQAAGLPDIEGMYQNWRTQNPSKLEQNQWTGASKGRKLLDILRVASGAIGGGLPGAVGETMAIHDHDLPLNIDAANRQRFDTAVMQPMNTAASLQERLAQAAGLQATTAKTQLETEQMPFDLQLKQQAAQGQFAQHGLKGVTDDSGRFHVVPDEDSPIYQKQQAQTTYIQAQQQLDAAKTEYAKAAADAKTNPNNPTLQLRRQALAIAMKNANTAAGRLGLSTLQYDMRAYGRDGSGNALPGSVLEDDDTPVGTAFQANVRPTGSERNKGDMAQSAHEQLSTLKSIVSKRPDIFGPAAGRTTDFNVWLGSQDPDAQRFRAARTIAGDHLAGTFGGRSEHALTQIDNAIGSFKDNPAAVAAGLDQLDQANNVFLNRGTPRVSNGRGGIANQSSSLSSKTLDRATATKFLQQAGGDKNRARQLAKQAGY